MTLRTVLTHRPPRRLSPRRTRLVYAVVAAAWISGVGWLIFHYFLRQTGEFGETPHVLEAWWLRLHGISVFAALWTFGLLWGIHVVPAWKRGEYQRSGAVVTFGFVVLALSGYLLFYLGDETLRDWVAVIHWGLGLGLPALVLIHTLRIRRRHNRGRVSAD